MSFHPDIDHAVKNAKALAGKVNATKKKWETMLLSVSFWNNISVVACMIAVSMDPLFFYIAFLDRKNMCLGMDKRLRTAVLITRSLTDFTFLFHVVHQIREAVTAVDTEATGLDTPVQGNSKLFNWFGHAKAIAKKLSWSSFLTDIFAVLPIPHVLILALFYAPKYGFAENKMNLNYMLLAQYVPRMYRIFISSRLFRKNSSVWLKVAFYFFMYILSSHVIGAFWHFSSVQIQAVCWHLFLGSVTFQCEDPPLSDYSRGIIHTNCNGTKETFDFGSFLDTIKVGYTGHTIFREKLIYFMWWGLKNLSNFGTNINTSEYIWENCFAILVSGIGLVLFALLIGNMQECMRFSEEKKVATDKIQMKEEDLQGWLVKYSLPKKLGKDAEKLSIEIMTKIAENLTDNKNAEVQNLFSLLPWNTIKDLKFIVCMDMLKKVRLEKMEERGLELICHHLKPVTYAENKIAFRMGEPLDSMLFIVEGIVLIYPTSTTTTTTTDRQVNFGYLEDGGVYGEELLSWASPPDMSDVSYAYLPILTENVKCHSEVVGFVLTAKDLKNVVSKYKLDGNYNSSSHLVEKEVPVPRGTSGLRNRINSTPRPGTEGGDEKTHIQDSNN